MNATHNLKELKKLLQKIADMLTHTRETEEKLQHLIARNQTREIQSMDLYRRQLQEQMQQLEARRQQIVPAGTSIRTYIKEQADAREREEFLSLLEEIGSLVYQVQNHQEVNRSLLEERLRFSREMQELLLAGHHLDAVLDR